MRKVLDKSFIVRRLKKKIGGLQIRGEAPVRVLWLLTAVCGIAKKLLSPRSSCAEGISSAGDEWDTAFQMACICVQVVGHV